MAILAGITKLSLVNIQVARGTRVGFQVGPIKSEVVVARAALSLGMSASHRKSCVLGVVEIQRIPQGGPAFRSVTGFARDLDVAMGVVKESSNDPQRWSNTPA